MKRSHLKRHMLQCKGKCKNCSERGIPCIYSRAVLTCVNCTEHGLVCSGGRTTVKFTKKTCPRCEGQIGRNHSYTHQPRCMGKCKECSERGISCTYLCNNRISPTVLTCVNCTEHELSYSGRITYKTDKICFRCEAVPDVSVDMFSSHETDCWGKCENCAKRNLPCQFRGIRGNCINCKDQNLVCSGRITYKNDVESSRDVTNSC